MEYAIPHHATNDNADKGVNCRSRGDSNVMQQMDCWERCFLLGRPRLYQEYQPNMVLRVRQDLDPINTSLARTSNNCKLQTRPLIREDGPHQTRNFTKIIKRRIKIGHGSQMGASQQDRLAD
jgi:hypothetical protein